MPLTTSTTVSARPSGWTRPVGMVMALLAALALPALWNGFPLLYFDTVDYVSLGFTWKLPVYRTAGYGFIALAGWAGHTVWTILVVQSLFTAYVLYESRRLLAPGLQGWRLAAVLAFALVFTSLPWVTSELMPDVFTGPAVLLTLMLALHEATLPAARKWTFVVLLGLACMAHPTHLTMVAGMTICIVVMTQLAKRGWPFVQMKVGGVATGLLLGVLLSVATNWFATGRVFIAPRTTPLLTFAVLFEQGLGERYLAETCGQPGEQQSVLCPYRADLPKDANQFLWHNPSFWKAGGWNVLVPEAAQDLQAILKRYPLEFAAAAARLMVEQLVVIRTGEGFRTMVGFVDGEIRRFYPHDNRAFLRARQQSYGEVFDSPMPLINRIQVPAMLGGLALLVLVAILAIRRCERTAATLATLVLLAYLGNAFICGAISNPADRYGNRLAWLTALTAVVLLPRVTRAAGREKSFAAD